MEYIKEISSSVFIWIEYFRCINCGAIIYKGETNDNK